ncbi:hypothetical protein PINS_up011584 [Pythium insidiosum]|nr:hypothetical protein PINS_up011584 [Pythium insidiosum]
MRALSRLLSLALASAVASASASTEPESLVNGWYPCTASTPTAEAANFTSSDMTQLPFECAEVRVPLCHAGICDSDRLIDLFVKRVRLTKSGNKKALWLLEGGPGASSVACTLR